ncbi:hypothetical protein F5884DRAFT_850857 [Xylogone sp. PMI_703]|nr:hypothetical protein F5884DRAFT_850857 [Xylogone sp. PMI_703]
MANNGLPSGALWAIVIVLLYSIVCLVLCTLLVCLLWSYGEKWSYVTLIAVFTTFSTLTSIIEQLHYAIAFRNIKQAEYENALRSLQTTTYGYNDSPQKVDIVLFWIQFYCYDVMALNILFWSVSLFCSSWEIRGAWLGSSRDKANTSAKIFSVLFPAIVIGVANSAPVFKSPGLFLFFRDITVLVSLFGGSILLILILYKYILTRRLLARNIKRSRWWDPTVPKKGNNRDAVTNGTTRSSGLSSAQIQIYDRALVTRFTIGFLVLAAFNVVIIILPFFDLKSNRRLARMAGPDFSLSRTIADIFLFLPGVTASLAIFLVFGTAKSWWQYHNMILNCIRIKDRTRKQQFVRKARNPGTDAPNSRNYEGSLFTTLRMVNLEPVEQTGVVGQQTGLPPPNSPHIGYHKAVTGAPQCREPNFQISSPVHAAARRHSSVSGDSDLPILYLEAQVAFEDPVVQRGPISLQDHQTTYPAKNTSFRRQEQQRHQYACHQKPVIPEVVLQNTRHNFLDDSSD